MDRIVDAKSAWRWAAHRSISRTDVISGLPRAAGRENALVRERSCVIQAGPRDAQSTLGFEVAALTMIHQGFINL
jgi:hypothetical protein